MVSNTTGSAPSTADVDALCRDHLAWAEGLVAGRCGRAAREHAGYALFEAARTYDPSTGIAFKSWATAKIPRVVIDQIRSIDGRPGTARHTANATAVPIESFDKPEDRDPSARMMAAERFAGVTNRVRSMLIDAQAGELNHAIGLCLLIGVDDPQILSDLFGGRIDENEDRRRSILDALRTA